MAERIPTKAQIDRFVGKITARRIRPPSGGDCWYCLFRDQSGKPWGEGSKDHLISHIRQNYLPGALVVNALKAEGRTDFFIALVYHDREQYLPDVKRAVKKYLVRQLSQRGRVPRMPENRMIVVNARGKTSRVTAKQAKYRGGKRPRRRRC